MHPPPAAAAASCLPLPLPLPCCCCSSFTPSRPLPFSPPSRNASPSRKFPPVRAALFLPHASSSLSLLPINPWSPNIDSQSIAPQLFAASLFPYLGFLYHITKSKSAPKLTLFGFYFLLVFVAATIPAGIYAKVKYGTTLANVDWLHGGAESMLTLTNLFIVLGLRRAIREENRGDKASRESLESPEEEGVKLSK